MVVLGGGGWGRGTLTFSSYVHVGLGPASTVYRPKKIGIIKHPKKYLNFLPRKNIFILYIYINSLETSAFEELGSEFINFASNCVINTLRLIVYLTGLSI